MTKKQVKEMLQLLRDIKVSLQASNTWNVPQTWYTTLPLSDLKTNTWGGAVVSNKSAIK